MRRALLFLFLILPSFASALVSRYQIGVLSCASGVELLDHYEGRMLRNMQYPPSQMLPQVLENFRNRMPDRADFLQLMALKFEDRRQSSPHTNLGPIDAQELILKIPTDCQGSVLLSTDFENQFEINQDLWKTLSVTDQTGVVTNWALAAEVFQARHEIPAQSIYIRNLNSLLSVPQFQQIGLYDLIKLLRAAKLPSLLQQGVLVDLDQPLQTVSEFLTQAFPVAGSTWVYHPPAGSGEVQTLRLKPFPVSFHTRNGKVLSLRFEGQLNAITLQGPLVLETPDDSAESIQFLYDGSVGCGIISGPGPKKYTCFYK